MIQLLIRKSNSNVFAIESFTFTYPKCTFIDASCQPNPCLNNGVCSTNQTIVAGISAIIAKCQCPNGFYGDNCQYKNFCNPNSCQNNGECSLIGQTLYSCKCNSSFLGENCELGMNCSARYEYEF